MPQTPLGAAIVQLARKRRVLDRAGCARLSILLERAGVADTAAARAFLGAGLLPPPIARNLLEHLPEEDQVDFGAYRPLAHLADGGMGSAWLAAGADGALVVVKTVKAELSGHEEVRKRFGREAAIMMKLHHGSVVRCLDCGSASDGTLFMALEFVDGGDLKDLLEAKGNLPEALVLAIVWQIADALVAAQQCELVHRDIKPANIFANEDGRAKLADFGIARSTAVERTQLTMQGAMVGSPYFMSPEQVVGDPDIGIASDIYSLGAVIFTCLTGVEPYRGSLHEVLHAHRQAPVPDLRAMRPQISHATAAIATRCLQKTAAARYPGPAALRDAVAEALAALDRHDAIPLASSSRGRGGTTIGTVPGAQGKPPGRPAGIVDLDDSAATQGIAGDGATIAMSLAPEPDVGATVAADLHALAAAHAAAQGNDATIAVADWAAASAETAKLVRPRPGHDQALGERWITLVGGGLRVVLVARRLLVLGKLCEPPVDICLRSYPVERERDACLKVSRQHLRLEYDAHLGMQLTDLGSGNGTALDGTALEANRPATLGGRHRLRVAGALDLEVAVVQRTGTETWTIDGAPPSTGAFGCGIECSHGVDAVAITRPGNEPGLAYAMLLRRLSIGGPGADLVLPGLAAHDRLEVGVYGGRWLHRSASDAPWQPLLPGQTVALGGRALTAAAGDYVVFG